MSQHYTKNTVEVAAFCRTCFKMTPHAVSDGRLTHCKNEHPRPVAEEKQEDKQIDMFGKG